MVAQLYPARTSCELTKRAKFVPLTCLSASGTRHRIWDHSSAARDPVWSRGAAVSPCCCAMLLWCRARSSTRTMHPALARCPLVPDHAQSEWRNVYYPQRLCLRWKQFTFLVFEAFPSLPHRLNNFDVTLPGAACTARDAASTYGHGAYIAQ